MAIIRIGSAFLSISLSVSKIGLELSQYDCWGMEKILSCGSTLRMGSSPPNRLINLLTKERY